jgi:hypothetical protein
MKLLGLDGKEHKLTFHTKTSAGKNDQNRSKLHLKAREILTNIFPFDIIHEEVTLPGTKTSTGGSLLYADFFIPSRNLIVEVNGEQHDKHIRFFHKNKLDFYKAQARDRKKKEWCELNDITIVYLNHNESEEEWMAKINER